MEIVKEKNIINEILPMEDKLTIANNILKLIMTEEDYEIFSDMVKKLTP